MMVESDMVLQQLVPLKKLITDHGSLTTGD
jgi:hypothetical protein